MPHVSVRRWGGSLLALLLLTGQQAPPAPPTLAQVRQAFAAAHPPPRFACPGGTPFVTLTRPHPALACLVGDDELTLFDGHRTTALTLAPSHGSYRHFTVSLTGHPVGAYETDLGGNGDELPGFQLVLSGASPTALGAGGGDAHFTTLDDSVAFGTQLRRVLVGTDAPPPAVGLLNDTGYLLQRAGYPRLARRVLTAVVQRAPTRAVAYLNRGDASWQLGQPAAAQADYRRYLALLHTQRKDTTRVPAYVRLALRLP